MPNKKNTPVKPHVNRTRAERAARRARADPERVAFQIAQERATLERRRFIQAPVENAHKYTVGLTFFVDRGPTPPQPGTRGFHRYQLIRGRYYYRMVSMVLPVKIKEAMLANFAWYHEHTHTIIEIEQSAIVMSTRIRERQLQPDDFKRLDKTHNRLCWLLFRYLDDGGKNVPALSFSDFQYTHYVITSIDNVGDIVPVEPGRELAWGGKNGGVPSFLQSKLLMPTYKLVELENGMFAHKQGVWEQPIHHPSIADCVKEDACFYTFLIDYWRDAFEKMRCDKRRGKTWDFNLTYDNLYSYFHGTKPDGESDWGLTFDQVRVFLLQFKLRMCVVNSRGFSKINNYNQVLPSDPEENTDEDEQPRGKVIRATKKMHSSAVVCIHNNHVYLLNVPTSSLQNLIRKAGEEESDFIMPEAPKNYFIMPKHKDDSLTPCGVRAMMMCKKLWKTIAWNYKRKRKEGLCSAL